ncbi:RNA polymerase II transcription factor B subunit 4-like [Chenopodium quinoa]|uniref:RNA polymerase II transcription factor B subunit 4-like n=1 Tax=Chenopodium quinoa TaxID=63459 RepID=UPI000B78C038|nr:RNA polymerase II transcription factor B subunit 4-like [Chenopodium quinoa]
MAPIASKLYTDDVSLVVLLLDTNPYFWTSSSISFSHFLSHILSFVNSILLLNQLNQVVIIATGHNTCGYIYDSSLSSVSSSISSNQSSDDVKMPAFCSEVLKNLEDFVSNDESLSSVGAANGVGSSLLSGSLSMALCYVQRVFRSGPLHPQPRVSCLIVFCVCRFLVLFVFHHVMYSVKLGHFSADVVVCDFGCGPEQYVAVMNSIFSAQRSMVPIDSCVIGAQHSAFLQQASYITGGVYLKPQQLDGLFQYLSTVFATDLHSRNFIQLPKPVGVDFRASCFCHKNTIDMGYICLVCLSIFCMHHKKCSTCGSVYGRAQSDASSVSGQKRKDPS